MIDPQLRDGRVSVLAFEVRPHENSDWPPNFSFWSMALTSSRRLLRDGWASTRTLFSVTAHRCSCGEAGCGAIAALIELSRDGRHVLWRDFRSYVAVFFGATTRFPHADPVPSRLSEVPDLQFDLEQYVSAIAAAAEDRSWETSRRRTARLLYERLSPLGLDLPSGLALLEVFPYWDGEGVIVRFGVSYDDGTLSIEDLHVVSVHQDPAAAAADMASQLLASHPASA